MKKKPERGLKALASGSLAVARIHNILDNTEKQLEHEIERENREPPKTLIGRARRKGEMLIHSKHVLFCVIILNFIDCILVLGELILDMYFIKGLLESSEHITSSFIFDMKILYPTQLHAIKTDIEPLYKHILEARIDWSNTTNMRYVPANHQPFSVDNVDMASSNLTIRKSAFNLLKNETSFTSALNNKNYTGIKDGVHHDDNEHPIEEVIAHAFHKASITILCILAAETILKILAYGKSFFERKLEVFDCVIVFSSLCVDFYFLKGISAFTVQDFVIILAFLVPWRVIRVVNSLVVAVMDHEHFRLKLLYKQKKDLSSELKKTKTEAKYLQQNLDILKKMALSEGIPEQKIARHLALIKQGKSRNKGLEGFRNSFQLFNMQSIRSNSRSSLNSPKQSANNNELSKEDEETCDSKNQTPDSDIVVNITENQINEI